MVPNQNFGSKINVVSEKNLRLKKIFGLKIFGIKINFWSKKILGLKNIESEKNLGFFCSCSSFDMGHSDP